MKSISRPDKNHINVLLANLSSRKFNEAIISATKILKKNPEFIPAWKALGVCYLEIGMLEKALFSFEKVSKFEPMNHENIYNLALSTERMGNIASAMKKYELALEISPKFVKAAISLAAIYIAEGFIEKAIHICEWQINNGEKSIDLLNNLGRAYLENGDLRKALLILKEANKHDAKNVNVLYTMTLLLLKAKNPQEALEISNKALTIDKKDQRLILANSKALLDLGKLDEAILKLDELIKIDKNMVEANFNLAVAYMRKRRWLAAEKFFKKVLELDKYSVIAMNNLGSVYKSMGDINSAITMYESCIHLDSGYEVAKSNLFLAKIHDINCKPKELAAYIIENSNRKIINNRNNECKSFKSREVRAQRRIGYVSADLRNHSVSYFVRGIFQGHLKNNDKIFVFSNANNEDQISEELKKYCYKWTNILNLDDKSVCEIIEKEDLDILVDLSGHTAGNRLSVFSMRPCRIQISYLGFPATTGVKEMDYRISDFYADPLVVSDNLYSEKLIRLKSVFCNFNPANGSTLKVAPAPCLLNGYITFGTLNAIAKINDDVIILWARILNSINNSKLLLEVVGAEYEEFEQYLRNKFINFGVMSEQLIILPRRSEKQFILYNEIDIALDPYPCNGGTTTCDALWMGVPVVTLCGESFASRLTGTLLNSIGMVSLVANSHEEYYNIALKLAQDYVYLSTIRTEIREKMKASALIDSDLFFSELSELYSSVLCV